MILGAFLNDPKINDFEDAYIETGDSGLIIKAAKHLDFNYPIVFTNHKRFDTFPLNDIELNRRGLAAFRVAFAWHAWNRRNIPRTEFNDPGLIIIEDTIPFNLIDEFAAYPVSVHKTPSNLTFNSSGNLRLAHDVIKTYVLDSLGLDKNNEATSLFHQNTFVQRVHNKVMDGDEQKDIHSDAFFPAIKYWYFPQSVSLDEGPFNYAYGSSVITPQILDYWCKQSVQISKGTWDKKRGRGHPEGSIRIREDELNALGYEMSPITAKANTLVIGNVFGFHRRGDVKVEHIRNAIHGSIRLKDPFFL